MFVKFRVRHGSSIEWEARFTNKGAASFGVGYAIIDTVFEKYFIGQAYICLFAFRKPLALFHD